MATLNQIIATLEGLREQIGGEARVLIGNAGNGSIEKARLEDVSAVYRTRESRQAKTARAVILYSTGFETSLMMDYSVRKAGQERVSVSRVK